MREIKLQDLKVKTPTELLAFAGADMARRLRRLQRLGRFQLLPRADSRARGD